MSEIMDDVKKLFNDVADAVAPATDKIKEKLNELGDKVTTAVIDAKAEKKEAEKVIEIEAVETDEAKSEETAKQEEPVKPVETVAKKAADAMQNIGDMAAPVIEKTKEVIKNVGEKAAPTVDAIKSVASTAVEGMKDAAKKATDHLYGIEEPFVVKNDLFNDLEKQAKDNLAATMEKADAMADRLHEIMKQNHLAADDEPEEPKPEETKE